MTENLFGESRKRLTMLYSLVMIIFLAIQVMAQYVTISVASLVNGAPLTELDAMWTIVSLVLFSISSIALFTLARWSPVSRSFVLSRPWLVLAWSVVAAIGALIPSLFVQGLLPEWPEEIQHYIDKMEALAAQLSTALVLSVTNAVL